MGLLLLTSYAARNDLELLLHKLCLSLVKLEKFSQKFLASNPQWKEATIEAAHKYLDVLATLQPDESSRQTARELGIALSDVLLANSIAIVTLFGYSHYLSWAGLDIKEPTKFEEVSEELSFARKPIAKISFQLALRDHCNVPLSKYRTLMYFEIGFGIGAALGHLTTIAFQEGIEAAISIFETEAT